MGGSGCGRHAKIDTHVQSLRCYVCGGVIRTRARTWECDVFEAGGFGSCVSVLGRGCVRVTEGCWPDQSLRPHTLRFSNVWTFAQHNFGGSSACVCVGQAAAARLCYFSFFALND